MKIKSEFSDLKRKGVIVMAKEKEKKPSVNSLRRKKAKEYIIEIRRKLTGLKHGYICNPELDQLEKLVT